MNWDDAWTGIALMMFILYSSYFIFCNCHNIDNIQNILHLYVNTIVQGVTVMSNCEVVIFVSRVI